MHLIENQSNHFGHTGCDGWKPIAGPVGHYVENNAITETTGYSNVAVNGDAVSSDNAVSNGAFGTSNTGISDEQLVAIALQSNQGGSGTVFASEPSAVLPLAQAQYQPEIYHQQLPQSVAPQNFHFKPQLDLSTTNLVSL